MKQGKGHNLKPQIMKHTYQILWNVEENEREMETASGLEQKRNLPKRKDSHCTRMMWP